MSKTFNMIGGAGGGIKLVSIEITHSPNKTSYRPGQTFDPAGMEVTATYSNGATLLATGWTYTPTGALTESDQSVTVIYTEGGVSAQDTQIITVQKVTFDVPVQSGTLTYNGDAQSPTWTGYNTAEMTVGGATSQTNAGTCQAVFTLKDKVGTAWTDGTTEDKTVNWTIGRATIAEVPSQSGSLTYNGGTQSPTWANYDSSELTLGGTTSGTNAGNYNAAFTPKANYQWTDGTQTKTVVWSIGKATGTLTVSKSEVTLGPSQTSDTFTVGGNYDGTLSVVSNNTGIATVSVSGNVVTVNNVNQTSGSTTITVSCTEGTNYTKPADKTVSVEAQFVTEVLNDNEWATISSVSANNQGANYWAVGDRKAVTLNGMASKLSINATYYVYILGFNHNSSIEGNGITFGTFKTALSGGKDICLISGYNDGSDFYMNSISSNSGGWKNSDMRNDILGSTNVTNGNATSTCATSPKENTLMSVLPADLRAVMKPMNIYTDNTGGGSNNASYVTKTVDYLPLLAEFEIFGSRTWANSAEQNYQQQYQYYKNGNSKVKYSHSSTGSTAYWWERSPYANNGGYFCNVHTHGNAARYYATSSYGVAPAFRV